MRSNVDEARSTLKNREETTRVELDGDSSEVIVRAMFDDFNDDVEQFIVDDLGLDIRTITGTPFGLEVEVW